MGSSSLPRSGRRRSRSALRIARRAERFLAPSSRSVIPRARSSPDSWPDESGRALLTAPAAGRYLIRVDAIGFSGITSELLTIAEGEAIALAMALAPKPLSLAEITVADRPAVCRLDPEEGSATSRLWDEARKAVTSTTLTRVTGPVVLELRTWDRRLDARARVVQESRATRQSSSARPFVAADPEDLHQNGWVQDRPTGRTFFGPDANLLLSEQFLDDHCFRAVAPAGGFIGLDFEPSRDGRQPDIQGQLRLDQTSLALVGLEFQFTGLELPSDVDSVGGSIAFARLPSGGWFIRRWRMRVPILARRATLVGARESLDGYQDVGGEAMVVTSGDGVTPDIGAGARATAVTGAVVDFLTEKPLKGALVTLGGVQVDTTDDAGRFRIEAAGLGQYVLTVDHPILDAFAQDPVRVGITLKRGVTDTAAVPMPSAELVARTVCRADPEKPASPVVGGVVLDSVTGRPLPQARVTAIVEGPGVVRVDHLPNRPHHRILAGSNRLEWAIDLDARGAFRICGVPGDRAITFRVTAPGYRPIEERIEPVAGPLRGAIFAITPHG